MDWWLMVIAILLWGQNRQLDKITEPKVIHHPRPVYPQEEAVDAIVLDEPRRKPPIIRH